jgi:uncharacterized membrane-anchored protein YitT (DUF2179 family)
MKLLLKEKLFSRSWFINYTLIIIGSFIMAAGYVFFITPHRIVPGGVYGISIVIHYLTEGIFKFAPDGLPVGLMGLIMNIPLTIFISGKVIDATLTGANYAKSFYIISEKYQEIQEIIIHQLNRGGTLSHASGLYEGKERPVIFTTVNRRELVLLENHIRRIDQDAFVKVVDAKEVLGHGFKSLNDL